MTGYGKLHRGMPGWWQTCEAIGEHQGNPHWETDGDGAVWEKWSCCDDAEKIGEERACQWCGTTGILTTKGLPDGWVADDDGYLCPTHAALAGLFPG